MSTNAGGDELAAYAAARKEHWELERASCQYYLAGRPLRAAVDAAKEDVTRTERAYRAVIPAMHTARLRAHLGAAQFADVRAALAAAGTDVDVECKMDERAEEIRVLFTRGDVVGHGTVKHVYTYNRDPANRSGLSFGIAGQPSTPCRLLSVVAQDEWQVVAAALCLPPALRDLAVFTEFLAALAAPAIYKSHAVRIFGEALETRSVDGALHYAVGGGRMPVTFRAEWAETCNLKCQIGPCPRTYDQ